MSEQNNFNSDRFPGQVALLWAGAVIGGSLIAAPAKFQVEELTMPVALMVGRAQFTWLAFAELALIVVGIAGSLMLRSRNRFALVLMALATIIFACQHLVLMPILQERSALIIAGRDTPESKLHLVYVAAECVKVALLIVSGFHRRTAKVQPSVHPKPL